MQPNSTKLWRQILQNDAAELYRQLRNKIMLQILQPSCKIMQQKSCKIIINKKSKSNAHYETIHKYKYSDTEKEKKRKNKNYTNTVT